MNPRAEGPSLPEVSSTKGIIDAGRSGRGSCDKQRYYLDLAKSRGRIGSIASQQCLYQLSILCK